MPLIDKVNLGCKKDVTLKGESTSLNWCKVHHVLKQSANCRRVLIVYLLARLWYFCKDFLL